MIVSPKGPKSVLPLVLILAASLLPLPSLADPPPWAPAHGWRKKNDPYYAGYTGRKWERDYGILDGRCNREAVGAVLGAATGGMIGSTVGSGDGRQVAIAVGAVIGAVAGAHIGRSIDESDRACVGHALELGAPHRAVVWTNPASGVAYSITPLNGYKTRGTHCREFRTHVTVEGRAQTVRNRACRTGDGVWELSYGAPALQAALTLAG